MINANRQSAPQQSDTMQARNIWQRQFQTWLSWLVPRPFDWVLLFLYIAVLFNFIVLTCFCGGFSLEVIGISGATLTLLLLDRWEHARLSTTPRLQTSIGVFLLRVALIETVAQIDRFDLSSFLYVLLPFNAVLLFSYAAGWWIGGLIWLRYLLDMISNEYGWLSVRMRSDDLIVFTMGIVFVLTMAKLVLQERTGRAQTEKLLSELEHSHQQLTAYAHQVAELATVNERNRLARDIHDSLGHYLTVINVQLEKALAFRAKDPLVADRAVEDSKRLAREALDDVRRSVGLLRTHHELFSLHHALQTLVEHTRNEHLDILLHIDGSEEGFSSQSLMALYRVAQEGLTNVQRHAQAQSVVISLEMKVDTARLSVRDDGVGFDAYKRPEPGSGSGGYGLQGVQERLHLVAGTLHIVTQPQQGMELVAVVPRDPVAQFNPALVVVPAVNP
jgi:signal transduction histidine kinase